MMGDWASPYLQRSKIFSKFHRNHAAFLKNYAKYQIFYQIQSSQLDAMNLKFTNKIDKKFNFHFNVKKPCSKT